MLGRLMTDHSYVFIKAHEPILPLGVSNKPWYLVTGTLLLLNPKYTLRRKKKRLSLTHLLLCFLLVNNSWNLTCHKMSQWIACDGNFNMRNCLGRFALHSILKEGPVLLFGKYASLYNLYNESCYIVLKTFHTTLWKAKYLLYTHIFFSFVFFPQTKGNNLCE